MNEENNLILTIENIQSFDNIVEYCFTNNKNIVIYKEILKDILNNESNFYKLISILENKQYKTINIYLKNDDYCILSINKISFFNTILNYITNHNINNTEILNKIYKLESELSFDSNIEKDKKYDINIDGKNISIPVSYFHGFLNLEDSLYNFFINNNEKYYKGTRIEIFIYSLINYFESNHYFENYLFSKSVINRFLELKSLQVIDYESINKIEKTEDPYLKDIKLNSDLEKFLFEEDSQDKLENIIKTYLNLCSIFTYDDLYYIDPISIDSMKHTKISYLKNINKENNKIVCFEFTAIFGYFLNKLGINYKVIQKESEYGYLHNYIVFRYDKFLICINPIDSVLRSDLTTVKIGSRLVGIYSVNQNNETQKEFENILNKYYKPKKVEIENEYLPANKIENSNLELSPKIKNYLQKIDLIIKKLNQLDLNIVDKISYFRALMKVVFTTNELQINVSECIVIKNTVPKKLVFVITLNEFSYMNLDNYYLIYDGILRFIDKKDLQELFDNNTYEYLNEKHIPGIKEKSLK